MGIPSLNSAIFYNVSLFTLSLSRARLTLSFVSLVLKRQADYKRTSYCHFFRCCSSGKPATSERSESRNLNHANRTPIHENRHIHGRHAHKQHLRARKTLTCATNPNQPCFQVYPTDHTQDQSISTYRNHPDQRRSTCPTWQGWLPFELRWQSGP